MGLAAIVGCPPPPPSKTRPLWFFAALRHGDHKSGRVMAIVTAQRQFNASSQKMFLV